MPDIIHHIMQDTDNQNTTAGLDDKENHMSIYV